MTKQPDPPKWVQTMTNVPLFVGMIANSWAKLEHAMVLLANKLLRTADPKVGKIVMFSANPNQRRDLLKALADISPLTESQKKEANEFLKEFDRLRIDRNSIVHGHWGIITKDGEPILSTITSRGKFKEIFEEKEIQWLIKIQNDIDKLVCRAFDINDRIGRLWPS